MEESKSYEESSIQFKSFYDQELQIFLYTIFQNALEKAVNFIANEDVKIKEKGGKILDTLIDSKYVNNLKLVNIEIYNILKGILHFHKAQIKYLQEDYNQDEFTNSLTYFNNLPPILKIRYVNYIQEIYNSLGIIFNNLGDLKKGLRYFGASETVYLNFHNIEIKNPAKSFNNFNEYLIFDVKNEDAGFSFYIDGGINKKQLEKKYTLTIFYLAQVYIKLGFKNRAVSYCSITLKREIEQNEYILKDAVVNCINLADNYQENQHFAQTEYILLVALSLLPDDLKKKKRLRASVHMQLGRYFVERMKFALLQNRQGFLLKDNPDLNLKVNKQIFLMNNLKIDWPIVLDCSDYEDAKTIFRLANTQLKKAFEYFVLDGFVTEHITLVRELSSLYKYFSYFEKDRQRVIAILERRISLIEPLIKSINDKVYVIQWQELTLELSEIYYEIFEKHCEILAKVKKPKQDQFNEVNNFGEKSINHYSNLLKILDTEFYKEGERNIDEINTLITVKLSLARIYSKLLHIETSKRVENLVTSFRMYEDMKKFFKLPQVSKFSKELGEQIKICDEMVELLPVKINKVLSGYDA